MDLSRESAFRINGLGVEPAALAVSWPGGEETLQPRAMQVLVVLWKADRAVVSRDTLVETCWGGRFVGDDAVNRVIGLLRGLAGRCGAFELETISRIGYRLIDPSALARAKAAPVAPAPPIVGRRSWTPGVVAGVVVLLAAGGVAWGLHAGAWPSRPPEVEVEPFAVSGTGLAKTFAADVREEMLTTFLRGAPDITLKAAEPGQRPTTYRLRGRIEASEGLVNVYARLEPPDGSRMLWSKHYEVPMNRARPAAIGHEVIYSVGCIMHIGEGPDAPGLSSPAMAPWGDYCAENSRDGADRYREIAALRRTIAEAPDFPRANAMLGLFLSGVAAGRPPAERKAMIDEGLAAAARAERLAPRQGEGYMAEARLRQDADPVRAEALYIKASSVGTALAQVERQQYGLLLERMGRIDDAIDQHRRVLAVQPNNTIDVARVAWGEAVKGQYAAAEQALALIERQRLNPGYATQLRLQVAIWAHDWPAVRTMTSGARGGPGDALIDALASGDKTRIAEAGAAYETLAADPERLSPFAATALALSGRPQEALAALGRLADRVGPSVLTLVYEPPFAEARRTPEFEALATRYGLIGYWRKSGHEPDFCRAPDPPPLCSRLGAPASRAAASADLARPG